MKASGLCLLLQRFPLIALAVFLLLLPGSSQAQEVTAAINGVVTDPSGAAVSGAKVSAKDLDRGTVFPTTTDASGFYSLPRLPVGRYEVRVENAGFQAAVQSPVELQLNQNARINFQLQVGNVSQTVEVNAAPPLLQTQATQLGSVIDAKTNAQLPLATRNYVQLTLLAPGAVTTDPSEFTGPEATLYGGRPYINGNREQANNFLLDGMDNNQVSENGVRYTPSVDAIQEFNMITQNASAEFGNFMGGIISVSLKSGTNSFHGDVFEYFRNDKLNANNWGNNWNGVPRGALRWNQFGGTFGGRIIKDKLFFFIDEQSLRRNSPPQLTGTTVMPTAWRSGDFSSLLDPSQTGGKTIQLYNPYSVDAATGIRAPFPNNIIPASLLNPAAVKLMNSSFYPQPQFNRYTTSNFYYSAWSYLYSDQGDMKLDWRPEEKDYFTARISKGRQDNPGLNNMPIFYGSFNTSPFQNGVINWTRTISPRMVNEIRFGVNNVMLDNGGADEGLGNLAQQVGINNAGTGLLALGAALGNGGGFTYIRSLGSANIGVQQLFANTTWQYSDNLTITRGRHMMKMGAQLLREWINVFYSGNNGRSGFIDFGGRFSARSEEHTSELQSRGHLVCRLLLE